MRQDISLTSTSVRTGLIVLAVYLTIGPITGFCQPADPSAPTPLPPSAQEALNKGIVAAKLPDYLLAIRFFEEARKIAPQAPVIYLNLGLAESRIPGRELRAIAWFGAFLAAYPTAPNAAAVRGQIQVLDVKVQSNLSHLIKAVQDAAGQIPEDDQLPTMGRDKERILYEVSSLWAAIGDIEHAQKTAGLIARSGMLKSLAYGAIARAQLEAGDIADAQETAGGIQDKDESSAVQKAVVDAVAKAQPTSQAVIGASDWLALLAGHEHDRRAWIGLWTLNSELFLDLDGFLKSLPPPSKSIYAHFWALQETACKIVRAHRELDQMLKQQAKP